MKIKTKKSNKHQINKKTMIFKIWCKLFAFICFKSFGLN